MPLYLKAWAARFFGASGNLMYLPFDKDFLPGNPDRDNRITLSQVGNRASWYIFVDFPPLDPQDLSYPHSVELHDNDDFVTIPFEACWSERAGVQHGQGPVPTEVGKHHVRLILLNREQRQLLSQSGDYFVDFG